MKSPAAVITMRASVNKHQKRNITHVVVAVAVHKPTKNIRKFKPKSKSCSSSASISNNFMCPIGNIRRICMVGTRTTIGTTTMMMGLQQRCQFIAAGVINSMLGGQNSQLIGW